VAKVTVNKYDIIVLDDKVEGKRHRLTTGKKADTRLLTWYKRHADDEFFKLYEKKFGVVNNESPTFKEYGSMVLEITSGNRNQFSQQDETKRFKQLCKTFGNMRLSDIKVSHIMKWQNDSNLAPKTIKSRRSIFNMIMEMALYDDLIAKNPLKFVKAPKKVYTEVFVYNEDEIKLLIEKSTGQFKNILLFNFFAGLRVSELIALRWNDIDFINNTIRVDTRIRNGKEDVTKSKRVRYIDMLPQSRKALKNQNRLTGLKNDFVFLTQYGKPYNREDGLNKQLKSLCIANNIKVGTTHTLRKSCNTLLKQYGMPLDWILDQLGHVEEGVNREHYTGKIKPDMSKIGRVLTG